MDKSKEFKDDLGAYMRAKDRSTEGNQDPEYTLDFLERCLYRHVIKVKEDRVKSETKAATHRGKRHNNGRNQPDDFNAMPAVQTSPKRGARAKSAPAAKAKAKAKVQGPVTGGRTMEEIKEYCLYFQTGNCKHVQAGTTCPKKHELLKQTEIEKYAAEIKRITAGRTPKGKGKGKSSKGRPGSPANRSASRKKTDSGLEYFKGRDGKCEPLCCFKFLKGGTCDNEETRGVPCPFPHITKEKKAALQKNLNAELAKAGSKG